MNVRVTNLNGVNGGQFIIAAQAVTGPFTAIQVIAECTFTAYVGNIEALEDATLPAGTIVYGIFTSLTLATGTAIVYRHS